MYTPYEGSNLTNHKNQKSGVFGREFGGSHSQLLFNSDKYERNKSDVKNVLFLVNMKDVFTGL